MKKMASLLLAVTMLFSCVAVAFADETYFTYSHNPVVPDPDPTYSITIPASITLHDGDNDIPLTVSDAQNFGTGKLSIKMAQTVPNGNFMSLSRLDDKGWWTGDELKYDVTTADGNQILYNRNGKWDTQYLGQELASFTGNGSKNYVITPDVKENTKAGEYAGYIQYTIEFEN